MEPAEGLQCAPALSRAGFWPGLLTTCRPWNFPESTPGGNKDAAECGRRKVPPKPSRKAKSGHRGHSVRVAEPTQTRRNPLDNPCHCKNTSLLIATTPADENRVFINNKKLETYAGDDFQC